MMSTKCHRLVFNERCENPHTTGQAAAAGPKTSFKLETETIISKNIVITNFLFQVQREFFKYWRRRRYSRRQSTLSGRSRTRASLDNTHHTRLSETWDNNANFELKQLSISVCNGNHDLNSVVHHYLDERTSMLHPHE